MDIIYFLDENINIRDDRRQGSYVPVTIKIIREGQPGFEQRDEQPLNLLYSSEDLEYKRLNRDLPVYVVIFLQHTGRIDEATKYFYDEDVARKYIASLNRAISQRYNVENVDVHYKYGMQNLNKLLKDMPLNTFTSFRTPTDTFSITLAKVVK